MSRSPDRMVSRADTGSAVKRWRRWSAVITGPAEGPDDASAGTRKKVVNRPLPTQKMPPRMWTRRRTRISAVIGGSTCAPAREPATGARRGADAARAPARRGARGAPAQPLTSASIALGDARYEGRVDAKCAVDEGATTTNTRAYLRAMYPWFGQRPPADQPQWRFTLELRRSPSTERYDQFVFSFQDGRTGGTIQTVAGSERMGSGTVRVTRRGGGARFEVQGRTREGDAVRATIDCPGFTGGGEAGG